MSIESMTSDNLGPLFDPVTGRAGRDAGIAAASSPLVRRVRLLDVKEIAKQIARTRGEVSMDDVARHYAERGVDLWETLGNAAGGVFRDPCWEFAGYVKSERARSHRNLIRMWRLAE